MPGCWRSWSWLAGLLGAGVTARRASLRRRLRDSSRRRRENDATLAELASIGQSSLDLAEVLPASCALLESALELDGLSLLGSGREADVRLAQRAGRARAGAPPRTLRSRPGAVSTYPLARGGRSLGVLRVRPRRELDEVDLSTLVAAAETLSSTIANADAYAHQRSMITRMRNLDNLKTVFVATASHELRTPVAAVVGYANMLTENWDDLDPETGLLYAQRVETSAQRLGALVENLLDFARLEQGRTYTGEKEPLDLGAEVQSLVDTQPDLAPDHELEVTVEPGLIVSGSRLAIERVVTNLVGNAAKYSPDGHHHPGAGGGRGRGPPHRRRRGPRGAAARARADLQPVLPRCRRRRDPHPRGRPGPVDRDRVRDVHERRRVDRDGARRGDPLRGDLSTLDARRRRDR